MKPWSRALGMVPIYYKILLFFLFLVLAPMLALGLIAKRHADRAMIENIGASHAEAVAEKATDITWLFQNLAHQARLLASQPLVRETLRQRLGANQSPSILRASPQALDDAWPGEAGERVLADPLSQYLRELLNRFPEQYAEILITDDQGATVAMSGAPSDFNQGDEAWWQKAVAGGRQNAFFEDRGWNESACGLVIGVAVTVFEKDRLLGVLKVLFRADAILRMIHGPRSSGDTRFLLARENGERVMPSGKPRQFLSPGMLALTRDGSRRWWTTREGGNRVLGAHVMVDVPIFLRAKSQHQESWQRIRWMVLRVTDNHVAFADLIRLRLIAWLTSLAMVLVIAVVAMFFARALVRPLLRLRRGVDAVGQGRLDTRVGRVSHDEIGELGLAFDRMTEQLQATLASRGELQIEVVERRRVEAELQQREEEKRRLAERLQAQNRIFEVIGRAQTLFIQESDPYAMFERMLQDIIQLTGGGFGFIGEVPLDDNDQPYLQCYAFSSATWNDQATDSFRASQDRGMVFTEFDNLFGAVITTGEMVLTNQPKQDPRHRGTPPGHPEIHNFLGLPVYSGQQLVGVICLANRDQGFSEALAASLQPVVDVCGQIIAARWERTARRQTEHRLEEATQRYRALFELSPEGLVVLDPDTARHVDFNPAAARQLGYEVEEFAALHLWDYEVDEDTRAIAERIRRIEQAGHDDFETRHLGKHGEERVVIVTAQFVTIEGKRFIFAVYRDITEHQRAERNLRDNERRLQLALEAAQAGTLFFDVVRDVIEWDDRSLEIFGLTREQFGNHYQDWARCVHAEDLPGVEKYFQASLRDPVCNTFAMQYRIHREDMLHHIKVQAWIHRGPDQAPRWVSGLHFDITAQVTGEEILTAAKETAEAATQAKNLFLANMSHELRTPLNAILGFSRLMQRAPDCPPRYRENLGIITRSGEHLLNMINDVLDISKIEAGRVSLNFEVFSLHQLIRDVGHMIRPRAEAKSLRFTAELDPDLAETVQSDPGKIRQILLNLLINAVKFTREGGIALRVKHRELEHDGGVLLIEVEDSGEGIPEALQENIFEAFIQGDDSAHDGTGLGLAITRQFVDLLEGEIHLRSELGKGTLFTLTLPIQVMDDMAVAMEQPYHHIIRVAPDQAARRMLVVEDHEANRELLRNLLATVGLEVRVAADGRAGVAAYREWQPDLAWMDIRMPVLDGMAAVREMRALPMRHPCRFIAVSASTFQEEREEILAAGFDDFLRKPYRDSEIYRLLEEHLGLRFEYETLPDPADANDRSDASLHPSDLTGLSAEWRQAFETALVEGEVALLGELIQQARKSAPELAAVLARRVDEYEFEQLLQLLREIP